MEDEEMFSRNLEKYVKLLQQKLLETHNLYIAKRDKISKDQEKYKNQHRAEIDFEIGDVVLLRDHTIATDRGKALSTKFLGPYVIEKKLLGGMKYQIRNIENGRLRMGHKFHLKKVESFPHGTVVPSDMEATTTRQLRSMNKDSNN